jgi:hypothetical protein
MMACLEGQRSQWPLRSSALGLLNSCLRIQNCLHGEEYDTSRRRGSLKRNDVKNKGSFLDFSIAASC